MKDEKRQQGAADRPAATAGFSSSFILSSESFQGDDSC
jgi:hypothetical protein